MLKLAAGTAARTEAIMTFGRESGPFNAGSNMDIDGNGQIDADDAKVQSVSGLIAGTIPATQAANATVTLSDAASDITTTGTALRSGGAQPGIGGRVLPSCRTPIWPGCRDLNAGPFAP